MKWILLFLLSISGLWGNPKDPYQYAVFEGEPSCNVSDAVNALTGDLFVSNADIVIQGVEPLVLKRNYVSGDGKGKTAGWFFFSHLVLTMKDSITTELRLPNGMQLFYFAPLVGKDDKKGQKKAKKEGFHYSLAFEDYYLGITNCAGGEISARHNILNNRLVLDYEKKIYHFYGASGVERCYKRIPDQEKAPIYFHLQWERLPNGNRICYGYDKHHRLNAINTTNPSGTKTYASASIHYVNADIESSDCDVTTSDGKVIQYRFDKKVEKGKDKKKHSSFLLRRVTSPEMPDETLEYHEKQEYRGPLVSSRSLPQERTLKIDYYNLHHNTVLEQNIHLDTASDPRCDRVKALYSPIGKDNRLIPTQTFVYEVGKRGEQGGGTEVYDAEGNLTLYRYNPQVRIESIDRFIKKGKEQVPHSSERFIWTSEGNLLCKSFHNEQGEPLFARTLSYDGRGNVVQERLYGNISGACTAPIHIQGNGTVVENGIESYGKRFAYTNDGRNLRTHEEEENGKTTLHCYLPHCDKIEAIFLLAHGKIIRRTFFEYDEDLILVKEIQDDGNAMEKHSLAGVSQRRIKTIFPRTSAPFIGMAESIEESYYDFGSSQEKLLKKVVFDYSPQGQIVRQDLYNASKEFCYSLKAAYDSKGRVIEETNAMGQTARSSYDENGNKILFEDFHGKNRIKMSYDYSNRLIEEVQEGIDGKKRRVEHSYDYLDNRVATTDFYGNVTRYVYDPFGHLLEEQLPEVVDSSGAKYSPVICTLYNSAGQKSMQIAPSGEVTKTSYNIHGKPTKITYADGTSEQFIYNLDGTLARAVDQEGTITAYSYDILGRELSKKVVTGRGELLDLEKYVYNGFQLISKENGEKQIELFSYDSAGRKIGQTYAGEKIVYEYDALGRVCTEKRGDLHFIKKYDHLDRVVEERMENQGGELLAKTLYEHDAFGNSCSVTRWIDGKEAKEWFISDSLNRPELQIDALGNKSHFEYRESALEIRTDALGNRIFDKSDALGRVVQSEKKNQFGELISKEEFFYDRAGNLARQLSTIFTFNESLKMQTTLWEYGPLNRLVKVTEAAGEKEQKITRYTHTSKGQIQKTIKPDGVVLENQYDPMGRLVRLSSSDKTIRYQFHYNKLGHLLRCENLLTGQSTRREVDPKGRVLKEFLETGLSFKNQYDQRGRRERFYLPDKSSVRYSYDALHLRMVERVSKEEESLYAHHYLDYDLSGNLLREKRIHNAGENRYQFDPLGRLKKIVSDHVEERVEEIDPLGHIKKISWNTFFGSDEVEYEYDFLEQLCRETGRFSQEFHYDSHFNRLSKNGERYELNALSELLSTDLHSYDYDPNGCPVSKSSADSKLHYRYDALGRLTELIQENRVWLKFTYDGLHRRLSKEVYLWKNDDWEKSLHLHFLYDGEDEIGAVDRSGKMVQLRILGERPRAERGAAIAVELEGRLLAPLHDLQGNIYALVDPKNRAIAEFYRYSAFGEEQIFSNKGEKSAFSLIKNPWRYCSKRVDEETGMVFFGRRYYDSDVGRFLTPDPKGFVDSLNLYAFVMNDPLTKVDLWGLETLMPEARRSSSMVDFFRPGLESVMKGVNLVGRTIYNLFFHMMPIPVVRQVGMLMGNLLSGESRNYYQHPHRDQIGGRALDKVSLGFNNGVNTGQTEAFKNGQMIADMAGGAKVEISHDTSRGFMLDLLDACVGAMGFQTSGSKQLARDLRERIGELGGPGGGGRVVEFAHSRGGITLKNAVKRLSLEERKMVEAYTFGSADLFSGNMLNATQHYVSSRDLVPFFSPIKMLKAKFSPDKSNVQILPSEGGFFGTDHGFGSPTYRKTLQKILSKIDK